MKNYLLLLLLVFSTSIAHAQSTPAEFQIYVSDLAYVPDVTQHDGYVTLDFHDPGLNLLAGNYIIYSWKPAFCSVLPYLKQFYIVSANSSGFMTDLLNYNSTTFSGGTLLSPPVNLGAYPNDYGKAWGGNQGELDLINARVAWSIDTGSNAAGTDRPIIGVEDDWVDVTNPDLQGKFAKIRDTSISRHDSYNHGAAVLGSMAALTNNNAIMAGMCPGCRIDFSQSRGDVYKLDTMSMMGRKVINISWSGSPCTPSIYPIERQMSFDEMYENGASVVAAAGDGPVQVPNTSIWCYQYHDSYQYPSSFPHCLTIASIGYDKSPSATTNVADVIDKTPGDSTTGHTYHDMVDLCAPGYNMHLLASKSFSGSGQQYITMGDGSSFAAPLVAGTIGLMLHKASTLSPYQVEWLLKTQADKTCLTKPINAAYVGKMGAGRLDAGNVLTFLKNNQASIINDPTLQTMVVEGVEIHTICAASHPQMTVVVKGGTPPYTYQWYALQDNNTTLNNSTIGNPTINSAFGNYTANYYVVVKDASTIQKVAGRQIRIKLSTSNDWDLAMRDSYLDMLDERNTQDSVNPRQYFIWTSPDIWNRVNQDGITEHEDPQYLSTTTPNYCYVRVRNVGCANAPSGKTLRMYWTKASTGEHWKGDWDTATFNGWPAGGEITPSAGITLGALAAGADTVIGFAWIPPRPQNYDASLKTVDVCFLGRIVDGHNPSDPSGEGMTITEGRNISPNVRNNNNIVTRNMIVWNLNGNKMTQNHQVGIANVGLASAVFNFSLATDKHFHPHLAGDIALIASSIKVTLPANVYSAWVSAGSLGNYLSADAGTRTITFVPSDYMHFDGITLGANQHEAVMIEIVPNSLYVDSLEMAPMRLSFLQQEAGSNEVYGNVTYELRSEPADTSGTGGSMRQVLGSQNIPMQGKAFEAYPNPASDKFTIIGVPDAGLSTVAITDLLGHVLRSEQHDFSNARTMVLDLSNQAQGVYLVRILSATGSATVLKVVRK